MYNHFITPKDAFRMFDVNRNSFLTIEEFSEIIKKVYKIADQPMLE